MLKSEFIEMGGLEADYEAANNIYMNHDLWLDRHEFMPFWNKLGAVLPAYYALRCLKAEAREVQKQMPKVFTQRELVARKAEHDIKDMETDIAELVEKVSHLKAIISALKLNPDVYNR